MANHRNSGSIKHRVGIFVALTAIGIAFLALSVATQAQSHAGAGSSGSPMNGGAGGGGGGVGIGVPSFPSLPSIPPAKFDTTVAHGDPEASPSTYLPWGEAIRKGLIQPPRDLAEVARKCRDQKRKKAH
jgi:hypothetical protein